MRRGSDVRGQGGGELAGIMLLVLAVLVAVGLATYSPADWPNSGAPAGEVSNLGGRAGALLAYALFFFLGYAAYPIPGLLFFWGLNRVRNRGVRGLALHTVTFFVWVLLFCTFVGLLGLGAQELRFQVGGVLGFFLSRAALRYFGAVGAWVLFGAILLVILTLSTGVRLSQLSSALIRLLFRLKPKVQVLPSPKPKEQPPSSAEVLPREGLEPTVTIPTEVGGPPKTEPRETPWVEAEYRYPPLDLLSDPPDGDGGLGEGELRRNAALLESKLADFDVQGRVVHIAPGPVVTRYEFEPAPGVKINRIVSLADDLALAMRARSVRIEAPIPGKAAVGIEIPHPKPETVYLKEVLRSDQFQRSDSKLTIGLGKAISGEPFCARLERMPHLLIAGATGSGKSVCINSIICSILLNRTHPQEVQFIMIDPKMLELPIYNGIPHLYDEVVTEAKHAAELLKRVVSEMERRYRQLARFGVRNIEDFNRKVTAGEVPEGEELEEPIYALPYLVVVVDELADLMLSPQGNDIELSITRLAQMARAVGIHLVLATQRPSVDVITGVIKANFPTRIAFQVASKVDSRTILDVNGAEKLLGRGDMLFLSPANPHPVRIHGPYISTEETERIVRFIGEQEVQFERIELPPSIEAGAESTPQDTGRDEYFERAKELVIRHQQGSISLLQRRLGIGYARAARLIDQLEAAGIVGPFTGTKTREVLVNESSLEQAPGGKGEAGP